MALKRVSTSRRFEVKDWLALQVYAWSEHTEKYLSALIKDISTYQPSVAYSIYYPRQDHSPRRFAFLSIDDRIIYQALGNFILWNSYNEIKHLSDKRRVFASIPISPEQHSEFMFRRTFTMFVPSTGKRIVGQYDLFRSEVTKSREEILRACESPWLIKTDISNFYGNVSHQKLQELLVERNWLTDEKLLDLLLKCLARWKETEFAMGLPVGYETSDYLANLFLIPVDEALLDFDVKRYVDDMYIFASSYQDGKNALSRLDAALNQLGLHRNNTKTEFICLRNMSKEDLLNKLGRSLSFLADRRHDSKAEGSRQKQLYKLFFDNYVIADDNECPCTTQNVTDIRNVAFSLLEVTQLKKVG